MVGVRTVFRVSPLTILFAMAVAVCATPVAFAAPFLWLVYLLPVVIIAWTLRTRTVVDADGVSVRRLVGGRRVGWDDVRGLRIDDRSRVHAVVGESDELALPAVHARDLPVLARASDGRVPDPDAG